MASTISRAVQRVLPQMLPLVPVERIVVADIIIRRQQEAAGAAGGVVDRLAGPGVHHVDDGLDERPRREVLPRAGLDVLGVLLQQPFVDLGLDVDAGAAPVFAVDERHQPPQLGRVLDLVLGLAEDGGDEAAARAQRLQRLAVVAFQLRPVEADQAAPGVGVGMMVDGSPIWRRSSSIFRKSRYVSCST